MRLNPDPDPRIWTRQTKIIEMQIPDPDIVRICELQQK
jgi:hypothetical protein